MKLAAIQAFLPIFAATAGVCLAQPSAISEPLPIGSKWKFHLEFAIENPWVPSALSHDDLITGGASTTKIQATLDGEFQLKKPLTPSSNRTKISLESECPISMSAADLLSVTATPTLSPSDPPGNTLSKTQLAQKSGAGPGRLVGGWVQSNPWSTSGGPRMKMELGWDGGPANFGGNSCIWMDDIDLSFELPVDVYIASEYVPGSCQYNAVLNHEKKHLQSFRNIQKAFAAAIEAEIKAARWIPSKANPLSIPTGEVNSTRTAIVDRIRQLLRTGYRSYVDKLEKAKESVDTPTEINRLETEIAAC